MSNFSYLSTRPEYSLFANSAIEAEKVFSTSPAMCAVGCRKALELAVKWVYAADKTITMPYKDNLQSLLHEPSFRFAVDRNVWSVLPSIVKAGNLAVHTGHSVSAADAVFSLRGLFDFIQWVDYCYGTDYVERSFDETAIPGEKVALDEKKIREQESLLTQKDAELEALRKQVESLSTAYTASKQQNQQSRSFTAADLTEAETRRKIIDIDLKAMGWKFTGPDADVRTEYEVDNMNGVLVHHLLGITVGSGDLLVGQLTAQCLEAGIHSSQRFQRLLGLLGHVVADHGGLAAVRVGGDRLLQKGFYIRGILIAAGQLCRLLIGSVLGQQIHAGGDLKITDAAHGVRGGNGAACKAEGECQRADQCKKFLFHGCCSCF